MLDFTLQAVVPGRTYGLLPTLLPNFSPNVAQRGLHHNSPSEFVADTSPRVAAVGAMTFAGTPAAGTGTFTVVNGVLGSAPVAVPVTITATMSLAQVVTAIINAINALKALTNFYFQAYPLANGGLGFAQPSGVGNYTTISWTAGTTGITGTVTNQPTGGSGSIVPLNNFNFSHNGASIPFWFGIPRDVGFSLLAALVSNNAPIC